jgi:hypothetical protein
MTVGIALYGPTRMPSAAYIDGFFDALGVAPGEASYSVITEPDSAGETLHLVETTWASLHRTDVPHLSVMAADGLATLWVVFDLENRMDIVIALDDATALRADSGVLLAGLARETGSPYGFVFPAVGPDEAMGYGRLDGTGGFLAEENPFVFANDRAWHGGPERFRHEALRMVYPVNVLMPSHLDAMVGDRTLGEWIAASPDHGSVDHVEGRVVWRVPQASIHQANAALAEAGLLLAWKPKPNIRRGF